MSALLIGKIQRVKTQRAKTSENFAEEENMFAEDISEDFSDLTFLLDFIVFLDIFEIFAEDCFLLRSFRKFLPSGFLPLLSRFQSKVPGSQGWDAFDVGERGGAYTGRRVKQAQCGKLAF